MQEIQTAPRESSTPVLQSAINAYQTDAMRLTQIFPLTFFSTRDRHGSHTKQAPSGNAPPTDSPTKNHSAAQTCKSPIGKSPPSSDTSKSCPEWPARGLTGQSKPSSQDAENLICKGACLLEGVHSQTLHANICPVGYGGLSTHDWRNQKQYSPFEHL